MSEKYRELVPWPSPPVGDGATVRDAAGLGLAALLALQPQAPRLEYRDLVTQGIERLGVIAAALQNDPRIHRLLPPEGQSFNVVDSETRDPAAVQVTAEGAAFVDLNHTGWVLLQLPSGTIRFEAKPEGLEVVTELARVVRVDPLQLSTPPLERWCEPLGDQWLLKAVHERLGSTDDPWEVACAAGMVATLADMPDLRPSASAAEALEARRPLLQAAQHLKTWAQPWSDAERATVRDLALVSIEQLDVRLSDLAVYVNPNGSQSRGWIAELVHVCHLRDDLDGVLVLTEWTGADQMLADLVADIDRRAEPFVRLLLLDEPIQDERLRRVWLGQPDAWWGWPAAVEEDD